jgi:hypothetical protein
MRVFFFLFLTVKLLFQNEKHQKKTLTQPSPVSTGEGLKSAPMRLREDDKRGVYRPSRRPSNRNRSALSLMKPSASRWS